MAKKGKAARQQESIDAKYRLGEKLGEGGNASVFVARRNSTYNDVALKYLSMRNEEKEKRFIDEINSMKQNKDIDGIMPVLDADLENYWYVMPIATPIMKWSKKLFSSSNEHKENPDHTLWIIAIGKAFIELARTLEKLHAKGIHHRDIKPDNIYFYNSRPYLGDFGLVEFPDSNNNLTRNDKGLGAVFTIAPEMKRNPKDADGSKADVYSLAKSLWMILSNDEKGFDGQYSSMDESHGLRFYAHMKNMYLVELEELLKQATSNTPAQRPDIKQFIEKLSEWLNYNTNKLQSESNEWRFVANRIFGDDIPARSEYREPATIVKILNILASTSAMNHMMFPGGGGLDFTSAEMAAEQGFIYIHTEGNINIIEPKALYFESFDDAEWNYFLIESETIEPIKDIKVSEFGEQYLVEDIPGHYVKADDAMYGVYDYETGIPLPKNHRTASRYTQGKFLIVMKLSGYNQIPSTYDGRHSVMSNDELRKYFLRLQKTIVYGISAGYKKNDILNIPEFGLHPYPDRIYKMTDFQEETEQLPDPDDFINRNFRLWDFSEIIDTRKNKGKIAYSFEFESEAAYSLGENHPRWYLGIDGKIHEAQNDATEKYETTDRETALETADALNTSIRSRCEGYDTSWLSIKYHFRIKLRKTDTPSHIFTKEEIEKEMRQADDRRGNQLVIDEEGYAHVIPTDERRIGHLYPVCNEPWNSRNNYVGKYSTLDTLENNYKNMLSCWLDYLKSGKRIYCDTNRTGNIENLLSEIIEFY